jgi:hypothetical protein
MKESPKHDVDGLPCPASRHEGKESEGAQTPKGNCGGRIDRHSAICHGRHRERGGTDRHE